MPARKASAVTVLAVASALGLAAGCSSDDTADSATSDSSTASTYEQALGHLPTNTTMFEFHDIAAADEDQTATARLAFDNADTAESDLDARTKLLKDGRSLVTGEPFSTYLTVADATTSASVETIELDAGGVPGRLVQMVRQRDTPFFACAPA